MPAFLGKTTHIIFVPGGINHPPALFGSPLPNQWCDGYDFWVIKTLQGLGGPSGSYLCIIIQHFHNIARGLADAKVGRLAKPLGRLMTEDGDVGVSLGDLGDFRPAGTIIHHEDLCTGRHVLDNGF
jgi:hypothetical protein